MPETTIQINREVAFFRTLGALLLLDIGLLAWMLNPLAKMGTPDKSAAFPMTPVEFSLAADSGHVSSEKPSPLGDVKRASRRVTARSNASAVPIVEAAFIVR